ncbi:MAG: efflux RND transporter periplasmic adaptor subunit [Acidobacteria bacterium]|nr:MAG: efflux RND transporter periplasmic adaptor subunit [Acidobacteriota bacterium]
MPLRVSIAYACVLASACVLVASACGGGGAAAQAGGPGAMPPADVKAVTLAPRDVPRTSEFIATVRSLSSSTIQPQVEGIVTRIFVKAGDRVRFGQPLVQISPDKQQASVASLEATRAARQADVEYASQQLARTRKLLDAGAVSRQELEQAETTHRTAEAQLKAVNSQIRESQVELGYYRVTAPSAGIVGEIPVRQGDRVTSATEITTIDQSDGLEAYISVPLERATELRLGLQVELLDGEGQVIATNPITFVAPRADDETQSVLVKAQLRHAPPTLRVKQYVRSRIVWSTEPALTVPVVAVNRVSGQYFVFVAENDPKTKGTVARQKPISVGQIVGDDYLVHGGLKPGERVIVSNVQKLGDGAPVKVG